jgi:hypothetical protein
MSAVAESIVAPAAQQVSPVVAASEAALNLFTAHRSGRKAAIRQAWADHHASATADLLLIGADIAEYIADGLAAGIKRAELVADCCGDDCSDADVSLAVKLHHLARLSACDLAGVSLRRVTPLTTLVVRDAETESYTLAGESGKAAGLVQCVVKGEVGTREAVKEHVAKLLGKSKPAATPAPSAPTPAAPIAAQTPAPSAEPIPADEPKPAGVGTMPLDSAQAAYRALTGAHDTSAAVKAFGALLGQNPKLIGPLVAGLVDWAASERSQGATMVYSAFVLAVKQGAGKLTEAGMRIGG